MHYDIIVVGSGAGGYTAALRAAAYGRRVAIVERGEVGGTCLNWGCIPTKALLRSAEVYGLCRTAMQYGVDIEGEVKPDLAKIVARSRTVASNMQKGVQMLLKRAAVDVIEGSATLRSATSVEVADAIYTADHIILATGAVSRELPFLPIDHTHIITSRDALVLEQLPSSIIIVGSGAIGCEFATLYAALGVRVTIIEYMPRLLPLEDAEVAATIERTFRRQRITALTSTTVRSAEVVDGRCRVTIEGKRGEEVLESDIVLASVGIKSNIDGIGLEEVGIQIERDKVVVNDECRTSVENIFAIGDIIATPALAHVAEAEARRAVDVICGKPSQPINYALIPSCVFTHPEVASVGITEQKAVAEGIEYQKAVYNFAASGRAMAMGERDGFAKLLFDKEQRLIGAHIVGAHITEMLGEASLACRLGVVAEDIAATIHAHPTMNEAIMEAAHHAIEGAE